MTRNQWFGAVRAPEPFPDELCSCPACGAQNSPMGFLGALAHFRCRQCGADYSQPSDRVLETHLEALDDRSLR